jgi:hypothetical protein
MRRAPQPVEDVEWIARLLEVGTGVRGQSVKESRWVLKVGGIAEAEKEKRGR